MRAAIEHARDDPGSTWVPAGTLLGPGLADDRAAYRRHFAGCRPPAPITVGPGRWTVPDNRWDLLADLRAGEPPSVSVVIPHYESPHDLDLLLTALELQDHPPDLLDVVVVDDGSRTLPDPGPRPYAVRVVAQADDGFRAAAARNLGARAARGTVLCFLLRHGARARLRLRRRPGLPGAPAVVAGSTGGGTPTSRRRSPRALRRWLLEGAGAGRAGGAGLAPRPTPGPTTCVAGDDAYRFVISAVLSTRVDCSRSWAASRRRSAPTAARTGSSPTAAGCTAHRARPGRRRLARRTRLGAPGRGGGSDRQERRDVRPDPAAARPGCSGRDNGCLILRWRGATGSWPGRAPWPPPAGPSPATRIAGCG